MTKPKVHSVKLGERKKLSGYISIVYAGMPSEHSYSLVLSLPGGFSRYAYNLFFPIAEAHINVEGANLHILKVTPTEIRFNFIG